MLPNSVLLLLLVFTSINGSQLEKKCQEKAKNPPRRNAVQFVLKFFELEVKENHFETRKTWPGGKYKHFIRHPENPLVWGGSKYYWDEHYQRNGSHKRLCFYDLANSWSKHINRIHYKNGKPAKYLIFECAELDSCCSLQCCRGSGNRSTHFVMYYTFTIGLLVFPIPLLLFVQYRKMKQSTYTWRDLWWKTSVWEAITSSSNDDNHTIL